MYNQLDKLIIGCIKRRSNPLYAFDVNEEASRIGVLAGRETFRVIDGRLQQLRKSEKIRHCTKGRDGKSGWEIVDES